MIISIRLATGIIRLLKERRNFSGTYLELILRLESFYYRTIPSLTYSYIFFKLTKGSTLVM